MKLYSLLLFIIISNIQTEPCSEGLLDICIANKGNYIFAKSFRIELEGASLNETAEVKRYSYMFIRNKTYRIISCSAPESQGKLIIELYGQSAGLIASTYNPINNMHYEAIEFDCEETDRYVLNFYFEEGYSGCGIGLVTFRSHF